jgi:hypothetical protein
MITARPITGPIDQGDQAMNIRKYTILAAILAASATMMSFGTATSAKANCISYYGEDWGCYPGVYVSAQAAMLHIAHPTVTPKHSANAMRFVPGRGRFASTKGFPRR